MTDLDAPRREPAINAPWSSLALPVMLALTYLAQTFVLNGQVSYLALSSWAMGEGRWYVLFTSLFLHAGVAHLLMNAGSALAFGPPVARLMGDGLQGAALFFLFFLMCGGAAGLGYFAIHIESASQVIGASGAISGLWGAASRLLGRRGTLGPLMSRQVILQATVFTVLNVMIGVAGGFAQLNIAWEAHLAGYAAGLILIAPFARLAARSRSRELPSG